MIGTIRKHSTWLWLIIIAATIVSFVVFFTPNVQVGGGGGAVQAVGMMNGRPISVTEYRAAAREAGLDFFFRYGVFPEDVNAAAAGFDLESEARNRLVLLAQLEALDIEVDDQSVAAWVVRNFADPSQPGSARANYTRMVATLAQKGVSEQQFADYIRHKVGVAHLAEVVGVTGDLVTPREAAGDYREMNQRLEAEAVVLEATNFLAQVQITPEAIGQFYTNRQSAYRTPERVRVDYVEFPASNYLAQAEEALGRITNLTERLDALYQERGASAFTDTNGQVLPPEAAKLKLREEQRDREAFLVARREAAQFGSKLFEIEPLAATNLITAAADAGIKVQTSAPFTESGLVPIPGAGQRLAEIAFKLDAQRPISAPLPGPEVVHIIALRERIPSRIPPLDEVRFRVTEEFRRDESRKLARAAGTNLVATLRSTVDATNDFASAVIASGHALTSLPEFSPSDRSLPGWPRQIPLSSALAAARDLQAGEISDLIGTGTGGFILHLKSREPVTEEELKDALPEHLATLQSRARNTAVGEWLQHRVELSRLTFPGDSTESGETAPDEASGTP
jgi:peptidyl-prolyl cis-trans isomerase D